MLLNNTVGRTDDGNGVGLRHVDWFESLDNILLNFVTMKGSKPHPLSFIHNCARTAHLFQHFTGAFIASSILIPPFIVNILYSCVPYLKILSVPVCLDL